MKTIEIMFFLSLIIFINYSVGQNNKKVRQNTKQDTINTAIMNIGYWLDLAKKGLVEYNPTVTIKPSVYSGKEIVSKLIVTDESEDILIYDGVYTQSENSIFVNPLNTNTLLNSNNSFNINTVDLGTSGFFSSDAGNFWDGQPEALGEISHADPIVCIDRHNNYYVASLYSMNGTNYQGLAISTNEGESWTYYTIAAHGLLDKGYLWCDNSYVSEYENSLYCGWTSFDITPGGNGNDIEFSYSRDKGITWSAPINISNSNHTDSSNLEQGANICTSNDGNVYAVWAIYFDFDPILPDENAIGFAKSTDGGQSFNGPSRIISNIRGIRHTGISENIRVNSYPTLAIDNSESPRKGTLYVTWTNIGYPGINQGDMDIYLIKSTSQGRTWSHPIKVNQGAAGKEDYFPWITCDPLTGDIGIVYYHEIFQGEIETRVSVSTDGGENWDDFKVSDVRFTPEPIPGLAENYFCDYIGITSRNGMFFPCWTDNRDYPAYAYTSPFQLDVNDLIVKDIGIPLDQTSNFYSSNSIEVAGDNSVFEIEGNGSKGGSAEMWTGNSITLKPGFFAMAGSEFHAYIEGNPLNNFMKINSISFSSLKKDSTIKMNKPTNEIIPLEYSLGQNYPNPFNPTTTLKYAISVTGLVTLKIYNSIGQEIRTLIDNYESAGYKEVVWDGKNSNGVQMPSGLYIYRIDAGDFVATKKMILLK